MLKVGIIGCGSIARKRHAVEYTNNTEVIIVGFADYKVERAEEMTLLFGGKVYSNEDDLLEDPSIDAVSVCVANAYHAQLTIKALNHGKHVLCEKPMAISQEECEAMVKAAQDNNKQLMIGHNQRLAPAHIKAKEIIESGVLGKVISFSLAFGHKGPELWCIDQSKDTWFYKKQSASFGSLADLGIHKIDLIRYLIDSDVKSVYAEMATIDKTFSDGTPIEVDDNSVEILQFDNGVMGTVTTSWSYYGEEVNSGYLYCEKGTINLYTDPENALIVVHADGTRDLYALDTIQSNEEDVQNNTGVIDMFVEGILKDKTTVLDGKEAMASMKVVFACLESANLNRKIQL